MSAIDSFQVIPLQQGRTLYKLKNTEDTTLELANSFFEELVKTGRNYEGANKRFKEDLKINSYLFEYLDGKYTVLKLLPEAEANEIQKIYGIQLGIIGVDNAEIGNLFNLIKNPTKPSNIGKHTMYHGNLWDVKVVVCVSNIGKVAIASAVTELILNYQIDGIIFIGTAGALDSRVNIGDIIVPKSLLYVDVDFTPHHQPFTLPFLKKNFDSHPDLSRLVLDASKEFLQKKLYEKIPTNTLENMGIKKPEVSDKSVGTTDSFLINQLFRDNLKIHAPEVVCVEMEGATVAQAAQAYNIPFTVIRTIANYVEGSESSLITNSRAKLDYVDFCKDIQGVYAKEIVKKILNNIGNVNLNKVVKEENKKNYSIGILCTLHNEAEEIANALGFNQINTKDGHIFYQGQLGNISAIIASSGIGKTAAAIMTTDLIVRHGIDKLISVGTACGVDDQLNVGDIVISQNLVEYDVDVRPFCPVFEIPTLGLTKLPSNIRLQKKMHNVVMNLLRSHQIPLKTDRIPSVVIGIIGSGDYPLKSDSKSLDLKEKSLHLLCVDSESAGVAQVAYQYQVEFVAVKMISGLGTHRAPLDDCEKIRKIYESSICEFLKSFIPTVNE